MKQFLSRYWLVAVLAAWSGGVGPANAGSCGPAGCGGGVGISDGYQGVGFNRAWVYPIGGFTVYPGQPGSCVPSHSDYSKVNWTDSPTANAQAVLDKLRALGIPQVPPDTIYLGKNPRAADNALLPVPKGWVPKEEEPKEADPKPKEIEKPKEGGEFKGKGLDLPKAEPKGEPKDKAKDKPVEKNPDDDR